MTGTKERAKQWHCENFDYRKILIFQLKILIIRFEISFFWEEKYEVDDPLADNDNDGPDKLVYSFISSGFVTAKFKWLCVRNKVFESIEIKS